MNLILAVRRPEASPLPVTRDRFRVPAPAAQINTQGPAQLLPNIVSEVPSTNISRSPMPTPRSISNRVSNSPDVRRQTKSPATASSIQNERARVEFSPTAQLLHKLFRNRDPSFLPDRSEIAPLTPTSSRALSSQPRPSTHQRRDEAIYTEIPSAPRPIASIDFDDDSSSEYLSIDNLSLSLNLENLRTECSTPPPPYRSIFDE
jgi:hypothetical protein